MIWGVIKGLSAFAIGADWAMGIFLGIGSSFPAATVALAIIVIVALIVGVSMACVGWNGTIEIPFMVTAVSATASDDLLSNINDVVDSLT